MVEKVPAQVGRSVYLEAGGERQAWVPWQLDVRLVRYVLVPDVRRVAYDYVEPKAGARAGRLVPDHARLGKHLWKLFLPRKGGVLAVGARHEAVAHPYVVGQVGELFVEGRRQQEHGELCYLDRLAVYVDSVYVVPDNPPDKSVGKAGLQGRTAGPAGLPPERLHLVVHLQQRVGRLDEERARAARGIQYPDRAEPALQRGQVVGVLGGEVARRAGGARPREVRDYCVPANVPRHVLGGVEDALPLAPRRPCAEQPLKVAYRVFEYVAEHVDPYLALKVVRRHGEQVLYDGAGVVMAPDGGLDGALELPRPAPRLAPQLSKEVAAPPVPYGHGVGNGIAEQAPVEPEYDGVVRALAEPREQLPCDVVPYARRVRRQVAAQYVDDAVLEHGPAAHQARALRKEDKDEPVEERLGKSHGVGPACPRRLELLDQHQPGAPVYVVELPRKLFLGLVGPDPDLFGKPRLQPLPRKDADELAQPPGVAPRALKVEHVAPAVPVVAHDQGKVPVVCADAVPRARLSHVVPRLPYRGRVLRPRAPLRRKEVRRRGPLCLDAHEGLAVAAAKLKVNVVALVVYPHCGVAENVP